MQTACQRCQAFLIRIINFQLGHTSNFPFEDIQVFYGTATAPRFCMVCRLFHDYLRDGKQLLVNRAPAQDPEHEPSQTSHAGFIRQFPNFVTDQHQEDVALEVSLDNAKTLRSSDLLSGSSARELGAEGPVLADTSLLEFDERRSLLMQAHEWLASCDEGHSACKCTSPRSGRYCPSRLLDLRNLEGGDIRLVDGKALDAHYVALSHVWGQYGSGLTTTRATLQQRQERIAFSSLPTLFRDAVYCTRELGLDYLWIDALCIVQDDLEDWETEAARMADIFRNAHITFAATGQRGSEHSLFPQSDYALLRFRVVASGSELTWMFRLHPRAKPRHDILFTPLNKRGWVLQELALSRRTLHFAKNQFYWHCNELARSADGSVKNDSGQLSTLVWWYGPDAKLNTAAVPNPNRYVVVKRTQQPPSGPSRELLWWRLVEDYSSRKLSFLSDKLIALAGIAATFQSHDSKLSYAAGMWEHDIVSSLLWAADNDSVDTTRPPELAGIPSWSWASIDGTVRMPRGYGGPWRRRPLLSIEKIQVVHAGKTTTSQVLGGSLHVRGQLMSATHEKSPTFDEYPITLFCKGHDERLLIGRGRADVTDDSLPPELWVLAVSSDEGVAEECEQVGVLLLAPIETPQNAGGDRYQRIGVGVSYSKVVRDPLYGPWALAKQANVVIE